MKVELSDLVVVTSNVGKMEEINDILGTDHEVSAIEVPEIQSLDLDEVLPPRQKRHTQKLKSR